ncbi:hypothetical protein [Acinetobacter sp.]|uniref:hypothetical protein n=1 Tax=Acinetobacter sp. TaxID=472 RepID=UPI0035B354EE
MQQHLNLLKKALIEEFQPLYQRHHQDGIYGCALVFNEYMQISHLALSTQRSIYAEHEDHRQYLTVQERWNIGKWRYLSRPAQRSALSCFRPVLTNLCESQQSLSSLPLPLASQPENHLQLLLDAFKQAQEALIETYALHAENILFLISRPSQPALEIHAAAYLNPPHAALRSFLAEHEPKLQAVRHLHRFKLSQSDKDLLIDLAQLTEAEPYDELHVAHAAYLLTLEPHFIDSNAYIQKLVQTIAAMATGSKESCAMQKDEILERINQFYHASNFASQPAS